MTLSIYELESAQEGSKHRDYSIDLTSSVVTMTTSFIFCAIFMVVTLSGEYMGWSYILLSVLKSLLLVGFMVFMASIVTHVFGTATVRRINSMVLGMILAFALVFLNIT